MGAIRWLGVDTATQALAAGDGIVVPTDTVWGVAVDPWACPSPRFLADLKGRVGADREKPVAWLVSDRDDLERYGHDVPSGASRLADEFWPGELTLIVEAADAVPVAYRSAADTIGMRWAAYWPLQILVAALGHPLAVTSANIAAAPPPRMLADVPATIIDRTAGVLGPPANEDFVASGVASAVVDCTAATPKLIRQGNLDWDRITAALADGRE